MAQTTVTVRPSVESDVAAITRLYAHHVLTGLASFEEVPPDASEIAARRLAALERGLPHIVAETNGAVAGFAYAAPYRTRSAYRFTVEDSVYVAKEATRQGIGRVLLGAVIDACAGLGYRQMVAIIGDSDNAPSIGLHARMGFHTIGVMRAAGFKFGRWVDMVLMQRALGTGDGSPPVERTGR